MPASNANETQLPRAVLRRSAAINARLAAQRGESDPLPANADGTPADPLIPNDGTPADPNPGPPADPRESDPAYWKSRFEVTSGLLRVEREARQTDRAQFNQRFADLQEEIVSLQVSAPVNADTIDLGVFFTPEEVERLGEDQCRAMAMTATKAAKASMQEMVDKTIKPAREARAADAKEEAESRKLKFREELALLVPDFEIIDKDEDWLDNWLTQEDPAAHVVRGELLTHHVSRFNAKAVAAMFNAYKDSKKLPVPPVAPNGRGATPPGGQASAGADVLLPLKPGEAKDFFKRSSLGKVTEKEREIFEKRRKLSGR